MQGSEERMKHVARPSRCSGAMGFELGQNPCQLSTRSDLSLQSPQDYCLCISRLKLCLFSGINHYISKFITSNATIKRFRYGYVLLKTETNGSQYLIRGESSLTTEPA